MSLGFPALSYLALLLANRHPTSSSSFARTPGSRAPKRVALPATCQLGTVWLPKARMASRALWLQMADRLFARQCHCSNPCNATHQASRISVPQSERRCRKPPAGARRAGKAGKSEWNDGTKWLTSHLLANFSAPIHATPRISLHEYRAPKRVVLPGDRQPGPARRRRAWQARHGSLEDQRHSNNLYRFRTKK